MNLNYAIFRSEPIYTINDLAQIGSHNKREKQAYKSNPDIKLNMSKYNVELVPLAEKYVKGFYNITRDYRKEHEERMKTEREDRKKKFNVMLDNSKNVVADELLFTATNRFFKNMSNEDLMKWANTCMEFVYEDLGYTKEQVLHATLHLDEKTPHIHCVVVPLIKKFDKRTNTERYTISKKQYIIDDESLLRSYIKGVFIMCGSVNDPKKSRYHLEFLVDNEEYGKFLVKILNKFDLNSKILKRDNKYMVYIKEAEKIGDFLRIINATRCLLYYEDIRIYRDHKNMTNRLNNCEQANVDKIINTATKQVKDIETIIEVGGLQLLDEKEQVVAKYRLKYKDASLLELSEIISLETNQPLTKSGVNHRMKKITLLANRIREKEN